MFFSGKSGAVQIIERQLKANQYVFDMKKKKKNLPGTAWAPAVLRQLFSGLMCRGMHYSNYRNIKT